MTYAGFFVHLNSIPPVLRWLQWLCPLKYALEALSVNEVKSGLQIVDVLQGVPIKISASLIMNTVRDSISSSIEVYSSPLSDTSYLGLAIITIIVMCLRYSVILLLSVWVLSAWCGSRCEKDDNGISEDHLIPGYYIPIGGWRYPI
jgi:hypothetical protein